MQPSASGPRVTARRIPGREPRHWTWALVLVVGVVCFLADREVYATTHNPNLIPGLLLVGASILPATFLVFPFDQGTRIEVPPAALLAVAAATGAFSVAASGLLEYSASHSHGGLSPWSIALIEETTKLLVPGALLAVRGWRRPINGLLLGAAAGAGFAVAETLGYSANTLINSHENVASVENVLLIRSIFNPVTHMAWTGLTTAVLWWVSTRLRQGRAIAGALTVVGLVIATHTLWDSLDNIGSDIILGSLSGTALTLVIRWLGAQDAAATSQQCG